MFCHLSTLLAVPSQQGLKLRGGAFYCFQLSSVRCIPVYFSTDTVFRSLLVSIVITVGGTVWSMFLSTMTAYGLSRKDLVGKRFIMFFIVFTMLFNGGMIPTFLVVQQTGLIDSLLALIIPVSINAFNMIILRSFFL